MTAGTVLVTGAAGFVGWHVCRALLDAGWTVIGVDNFDPFYPRDVKEAGLATLRGAPAFRFAELDLRDGERLHPLLAGVDAVVHLAARPGVRQSVGSPAVYEAINVGGTAALLGACRDAGIRRVVFASSSSVYGQGVLGPFREDEPLGPAASPYGATKREGERLVAEFAGQSGARAACLRLFSVYGPRIRPDLAMYTFADHLSRGTVLPILGDGSAARDYTHASDIARGIQAALDWTGVSGPGARVFNLGAGRPVRLDLLVARLAAALGVEARIELRAADPADLPVTWADPRRASRELGFTPRVTLEEGIADFVTWFVREHGRHPCPTA